VPGIFERHRRLVDTTLAVDSGGGRGEHALPGQAVRALRRT
jgi:hypothetical protein